ncbi:MAG TPA: hypothetical protein VGK34_05480, partial [Armatimonadota bacterium]
MRHFSTPTSGQNDALSPAVEEFLTNCRIKNLSSNTVEFYKERLKVFMAFCCEIGISDVQGISGIH